nr:hypothetical protein [Kibdelosporangium sp. MJ126-NF4]CTQ97143.1 hypothetical protein [Kibdelosporangium sp. MJ126-NF4]
MNGRLGCVERGDPFGRNGVAPNAVDIRVRLAGLRERRV